MDEELNKVNDICKTDLESLVNKGYASIDEIPGKVGNQTVDVVADVKKVLDSISSTIKNVSQSIPVEEVLSQVSRYVNDSNNYFHQELPKLEEYDSYCGIGFSFLFCWILMILVVLTFVVGANVEKLICEPYANKQLLQVLDTSYLLREDWHFYLSGLMLNNPNINLTFEQVYSDCKKGRGVYATFQLEHVFNVSENFNIEKHTGKIIKELENLNVDIDNIELFNKTGRENLENFVNSGIDAINYPIYLKEAEKSPTKVDLLVFASSLEEKTDKLVHEMLLAEAP